MIAFASCTKIQNEENLSLRLDFPAEDTHQIAGDVQAYTIHTDELTVSFDILTGAGGYTVQVMENYYIPSRQITLPGGTARIEGKTVTVDLLDDAVDVVVSDLSGAESHVYIYSSHPAVRHFSWSKCVPYGGATKNTIDFGAGEPYRIVYYSDMNAAYTPAARYYVKECSKDKLVLSREEVNVDGPNLLEGDVTFRRMGLYTK